ncbi:MAG TPA: TolC family protein [Balneolaceae bacterium]|nr:TolC family protein [Balneolaceae bacterium]
MRIFWILFIGIGFTGIFFQTVQAQTTESLTVEESVERGLEYNFRLHAASADAEAAEASHRMSRAARLPSIRTRASYMRLSDNIPSVDFIIPGTETPVTLLPVELNQFYSEVSIEQPLFTGGRLNSQIDAAEHQAEASRLMEKQEQADVAFEIRQAYWNLYRALATREALETAVTRVDEHLRDVRNRVEEGTALRTDLLNAETRRSEVLLDRVDAQSQVRVARLVLNRLIGLPSDTETEVIYPEGIGAVSYEMDNLVESAYEQQPGLLALSEQVSAHQAEVRAIQGGWLPEVSLVGRYIYARPNQYFFAEQDQFRGTWEAGVALRWNIWSGGQRLSETSRAKALLRSAEAGMAEMKNQINIEVARRYLELERSAEALEVAATGIGTAEEAFRSARMQYQQGVALAAQVLDAEDAYRSALARYAAAVADQEIARASIWNALGQIWGDHNEF